MNRLEYINTPKYLLESVRLLFYSKRIVFETDIDKFKTKKSLRQEDKDRFQLRLSQFMAENNIRTFTTDVCLTIDIYIHQENAPSIQNIPKVYIDLIEKVVSKKVKKRKNLLISNDQNIKVLKVNYHRSDKLKNYIQLTIQPFSVIRKAINILYRLEWGLHTYDDSCEVRKKEEYESHFKRPDFETYDEFTRLFSEEENSVLAVDDLIWYWHCKRTLQSEYFNKVESHDYFPLYFFYNRIDVYGYSSLRKKINDISSLTHSYNEIDRLSSSIEKIDLTSYKFQIGLPENPQNSGDSLLIKKEINLAISNILKLRPELSPMFVPMSVLVVVLPGKENDVDVDNLARKLIIPAIEEGFKPPADYFSRVSNDDLRYEISMIEGNELKQRDPTLDRFFKNNSVRDYECIKLERSSTDKQGFIKVCLFSNYHEIGFVERVSNELFRYEID